ncbi:MAG: type II secretion system protein C [Pseudomonadales bacterium]
MLKFNDINFADNGQKIANLVRSSKSKKVYWIVVAVLCCWLTVKLMWMIVSPPIFNDQPIKVVMATAAKPTWNWFAAVKVQKVENIQPSRINAELLGVIIVGTKAVASISTPKKKRGVYRVGDKLQRGVTVDAIEDTRVVLDENGRLRELKLKAVFEQGIITDKVTGVTSTSSSIADAGLADMVSLSPVTLADKSTGIKLQRAHADLLAMGDMREGDIIVQVGKVAVSELMNNPIKLQALMSQTSVPIIVERDGQRQEIYVNVAALAEKLMPQLGGSLF